jgi:uncharacterized membrane protein YbhN (UPF0104 family)
MKVWQKTLVSLALLGALVAFIPWDQALGALRNLSFGVWAAALGAFLAGHLIGVAKWRLIVNAGGGGLRGTDAVMCYAAGLFANLCLPSIVGGDVLRAVLAGRVTRRLQPAVWGGIVDRLIDTLTLVVLMFVGATLAHGALPGVWAAGLRTALVIGVVGAALFVPLAWRRPLAKWPKRLRRHIGRSLVALRRLARSPAQALGAAALSMVIQTSFVLVNAALGRRLGIAVPLAAWFLVWPLAKIVSLVPISLGGLAVREASLAALLLPFGVPVALGVLSSLVWQTLMIAGGLLSGLVWLVLRRRPSARAEALGLGAATARSAAPSHANYG